MCMYRISTTDLWVPCLYCCCNKNKAHTNTFLTPPLTHTVCRLYRRQSSDRALRIRDTRTRRLIWFVYTGFLLWLFEFWPEMSSTHKEDPSICLTRFFRCVCETDDVLRLLCQPKRDEKTSAQRKYHTRYSRDTENRRKNVLPLNKPHRSNAALCTD